ncbi:hypothetical protein [Vulgatibacter sp.]|uniref:hypothetical protein n=1 Tax=Vulgatibacter sp. TaxID=1971226 RepID=UPI003569E88F
MTPGPGGSFRFTPGPRHAPVAPAPPPAPEEAPPPPLPPPPRGNQNLLLATLGALLVVAGLGAVAGVVAAGSRPSPEDHAGQARLAAWALAEPTLAGNAAARLAEGRAGLATDTAASLDAARRAFRRAAVLAPAEREAATGWLEAVALLEAPLEDPATRQTALDLGAWLLRGGQPDPAIERAWAHVLLSLGGDERRKLAQVHAARAVELSGRSPGALVALARSWSEASPSRALALAEEALRIDPTRSRALLLRGLARLQLGDPAGAAADLQSRLRSDPADAKAFRALAELALSVGSVDAVRTWAEALRATQPDEAALQLARITWQIDGDATAAAAAGRLLDRGADLDPAVRAGAAALLLAVRRADGDLAEALARTRDADPASAASLAWQLALHALDAAAPAEAAAFAALLPAQDPAVRLLLGRIALAAGNTADAIAAFRALHEESPWRRLPLLFLAAAEARAGGAAAAYGTLRTLAELDPERVRPSPGPFFEPVPLLLAGLHEPLLAGGGRAPSDAPALAGAALLRHHQGAARDAARLAEESLRLDPDQLLARLVEFEVALERGDTTQALRHAERIGKTERLSPVGPLLAGRAQERLGRERAAHASYLLAIERRIAYLPALQRLGALDARSADREAAEARLREVLARDPDNRSARTALFRLRPEAEVRR